MNINTEKHIDFRFVHQSTFTVFSMETLAKKWKVVSADLKTSQKDLDANCRGLLFHSMLKGLNQAEAVELVCQMIRLHMNASRVREFVVNLGFKSLDSFADYRNMHMLFLKAGAPIFRDEITIILDDISWVDKDQFDITAIIDNTDNAFNMLILDWFDKKDMELNPENYLIAEDEWYPNEPKAEVEPDQDFCGIENDNDNFVDLSEKKDSGMELVEILPNKQKLVRVRKADGNMHYIVVGEEVDIARLPKIYNMFLREELMMGRNITTDRLTRIIKIQEMLEIGFTKSEIAEYLEVPKHIVYSDASILREIEILSNK